MQNPPVRIPTENAGDLDADPKVDANKALSKTTISRSDKPRPNFSLKVNRPKDKELISNGLQRLASSLSTANRTTSKIPLNNVKKLQSKVQLEPEKLTEDIKGQSSTHIDVNKQISIDQYTMTDFQEEGKHLDIDNSRLVNKPCRDFQGRDPRLLTKYALTKPYKKSMTIPILDKADLGNDLLREISDDEKELEALAKKHVIFKATVSCVGSFCGIVLFAMLMWKVIDEDLLGLLGFHFKSRQVEEKSLQKSVKYMGDALVHIINTTLKKILHFLTVPSPDHVRISNAILDILTRSGVYKLKCNSCPKFYLGHRSCSSCTRTIPQAKYLEKPKQSLHGPPAF